MERFKEKPILDLILMNIVFAIPTALVLAIFQDVAIGARLLIVVILYNILLPLWAQVRDHKEWLEVWTFVFPISVLMIFPDWFLASQLEVLSFPVDGFPMIGAVPIYMAGLWVIPLFLIVYTGLLVREKGVPMTTVSILIMSLLLFGGSEATLWMLGSWYAHDVLMIGNVAIYIIIPELILGLSTYIGYLMTRKMAILHRLVMAFIIMVMYIGNASFFYFIIERLILGA
ncbi:MAG: DUF6989 domain-containing protein [Candidatus Thorarchaeota archaeon]